MHLVFVYGTLKRGKPNHALLADAESARLIGRFRTQRTWPLVISGRWFSPVMFPEPDVGVRVAGEVYEVDDRMLAALDHLESVHLPTGYVRQPIVVEPIEGGAACEAWCYFKPRDRVPIVHSGYLADYEDDRYVPAARRGG